MNERRFVVGFALVTLLIYKILPYNSEFVEDYYSNGLFVGIRYFFDYTLGLLPFPSIYLLFILLLALFYFFVKRIRALYVGRNKYQHLIFKIIKDLLVFGSCVIICFYWFWGFNYKRPSFEIRNSFEKQKIEEDWLFEELEEVHAKLIVNRGFNENESIENHSIEKLNRLVLNQILPELGYPTHGRIRVRSLVPKGILLVWSTAGVYLPFVSEGHIDQGLPDIVQPFTMAHEMSHGYGIGEESTCNFTAFIACINSSNSKIRYSGWMGYFRYLMSACRRTNAERFRAFSDESLNDEVRDDINRIYKELNKYPDILPFIRDKIYNSYLKSHGIKEGTLSYSRMIHLASAWKAAHDTYHLIDE